jgi:hypothetical protein
VQGNRQRWAWTVTARREVARRETLWEDDKSRQENGFDIARPEPPRGFPEIDKLDFALTPNEAAYLRERLKHGSVDGGGEGLRFNAFPTFLAHGRRINAGAAWEHPRFARLPEAARDLLELAAAFSSVMHGATMLYNLRVSELMLDEGGKTEVRDRHAKALADWRGVVPPDQIDLVLRRIDDLPNWVASPATPSMRASSSSCANGRQCARTNRTSRRRRRRWRSSASGRSA